MFDKGANEWSSPFRKIKGPRLKVLDVYSQRNSNANSPIRADAPMRGTRTNAHTSLEISHEDYNSPEGLIN